MFEVRRTDVNDPFYGLKVFKDGERVGTLAIGDGQGALPFAQQTGEFMDNSGEKEQDVSVALVYQTFGIDLPEESNEMNEGTKTLVQHLARGENRKAEEAFKNVMDQKIGNAMRAKMPEVAQSMFNNEKS
jgi:predicted nucleotide-binding protein (sugar kinase/HSP70/actin superfamily)